MAETATKSKAVTGDSGHLTGDQVILHLIQMVATFLAKQNRS